ncbi:MAG TPA: hypothetical protein VM785_03680, partial [Gaiellales bacterium]|nr:hypothetical protein [Gaiellales bacterium]
MRLRAIAPVALVLVVTGCGHGTELGQAPPPQITVDGLRMPARATAGPWRRRRQYGIARRFVPMHRAHLEQGSGVWDSPRLILNRPTLIRPEHRVYPTE